MVSDPGELILAVILWICLSFRVHGSGLPCDLSFQRGPSKVIDFQVFFFFLVGEKGSPTHSMLHSMSNSLKNVKSNFHL